MKVDILSVFGGVWRDFRRSGGLKSSMVEEAVKMDRGRIGYRTLQFLGEYRAGNPEIGRQREEKFYKNFIFFL